MFHTDPESLCRLSRQGTPGHVDDSARNDNGNIYIVLLHENIDGKQGRLGDK